MPLLAGSVFGPYQILAPLGAGGMGEVYRARDTRLDRDVAIKILPSLFSSDADRLARFEREAKTLASLNHPNIAAIYGIEADPATGSGRALVMELVEGEDLSDRISRGAMPLSEALPIARQIAEALEAAHERGIIHRDLKPANIKVRDDGTVKVLDFGLAKAMDPAAGTNPNLMYSPTITSPGTQLGTILGTAAYMAPEQARGRVVDKRADVWAFGSVLFEMLTASKAFAGEDATEIISAVVKGEPNWKAMPSTVPSRVRAVVARCLVKDPKARIPDLSVVRYLLEESSEPAPPAAARPPALRVWQAAAAVLLLTTLAAGAAWYRAGRVTPAVTRFTIAPPAGAIFTAGSIRGITVPVISPDGRTVAFTAQDASGKRLLWVRALDSLSAQPIAGTEGAGYPFWSPDSRTLGYARTGQLMRVDVTGGPPTTICALNPGILSRGGAWSRDGVIVFNNGPAPLYRVAAAGGDAAPIGQLRAGEVGQQFPAFLPDGRHFLYSGAGPEGNGVYVGSLDSTESTRVVSSSSGAVYSPRTQHLLFARRGTLLAQRFDLTTLAVTGDPSPVAEHVESAVVPGVVAFSLSDAGVLVYGIGAPAGEGFQLAWVDRSGKFTGATVGPQATYRGINISIDGSQVAAHRHEENGGDIWVTDLSRNRTSRLTFAPEHENVSPVWSPDGSRIAFGALRAGKPGIYVKASNNTGNDELVHESSDSRVLVPSSWSPDGAFLVFGVVTTDTGRDLWKVSMVGAPKAAPLLRSPFGESHGQISPDGRWLAYVTNETSTSEVYVVPSSGSGGKWAVSTAGGNTPRWRGDSRELFYSSGGRLMAVDVTSAGTAFIPGEPRELFGLSDLAAGGGHSDYFAYAPAKDGQRFLLTRRGAGASEVAPPIVVVLDWASTLK